MKQLISYFQTNKFRVALILLFALAIFFEVIWLYLPEDFSEFKSLGLNAFTEIIGIMITVAIVDKLLQEQEERKLLPLKIAAHRDVGHFIVTMNTFWRIAYDTCVQIEMPKDEPVTVMFTPKYFNEIGRHLNLDASAPVIPKRTWNDFIKQKEDEFRQQGEKILERYTTVLEPEIYNLIHKILNNFLNRNLGLSVVDTIRRTDKENGIERGGPFLGNYWFRTEESLQELYAVHEWYYEWQPFYQRHIQNKKES